MSIIFLDNVMKR